MIKHLLNADRRRTPVKYAAIAALIAAASFAALEAAGTALTGSYSGLGGKLGSAPSRVAPALSPLE